MNESYIICSYYTMETEYVDVMHQYLLSSLRRLKLKSDVRGVPNLGSWNKNTSFKSKFVRQMLEAHSENIVFLDADAEICKLPEMFESVPEDYLFAAHVLDREAWYNAQFPESEEKELLSGTLFIRNCSESKRIVDDWANECKTTSLWEQKVLANVLKRNKVRLYELPIEYCWIKTLPNGSEPLVRCSEPVIVHNQVSRRLRNTIHD